MHTRFWKHCAPSQQRSRADGTRQRLDQPHRADPRPGGSGPPLGRALVSLCVLFVSSQAFAADTPDITRVEEDWVVEIGEPNFEEEAPQITTVISPDATLDGYYGVFELNHSTLPDYTAGGMQLQMWKGDDDVSHYSPSTTSLLSTVGEEVTFTSAMALKNGFLRFEIRDGASTTWGNFGGTSFRVKIPSTLTTLASYSPAFSARNSKVGFAANRVRKMSIKQVRYYSYGNLVGTDNTERVASTPGATDEF